MTTTEYAAHYASLAAKYQVIRPQVAKWASSLTSAELSKQLAEHGVPHITHLVDVVARKKAIA